MSYAARITSSCVFAVTLFVAGTSAAHAQFSFGSGLPQGTRGHASFYPDKQSSCSSRPSYPTSNSRYRQPAPHYRQPAPCPTQHPHPATPATTPVVDQPPVASEPPVERPVAVERPNVAEFPVATTAPAPSAAAAAAEQAYELTLEAKAAFAEQDYETAKARMDRVVELSPESSTAYQFRGMIHYALADYDSAAADIYETLLRGPLWNWRTVYPLYGSSKIYSDQYHALSEAARQDPNSMASHFVLAYHHLMLGHLKHGEKELQTVLEIAPNEPVVTELLSVVQKQGLAGQNGSEAK